MLFKINKKRRINVSNFDKKRSKHDASDVTRSHITKSYLNHVLKQSCIQDSVKHV